MEKTQLLLVLKSLVRFAVLIQLASTGIAEVQANEMPIPALTSGEQVGIERVELLEQPEQIEQVEQTEQTRDMVRELEQMESTEAIEAKEQAEEALKGLEKHELTEQDIQFADEVSSKGLDMTLDYIDELLSQNKIYGEDYSNMQEQAKRGDLSVFVSTSMPLAALREYAREAVKYNAALVFKGLPKEGLDGWKELAKLIEDLDLGNKEVAIQIDEEPFDEFEVRSVPTIILKQGDFCMTGMSCKTSFDKVSGNIGIKAALEQFAREGEIQTRAQELLNGN